MAAVSLNRHLHYAVSNSMININTYFHFMSERYWLKGTYKIIFFPPIKLMPYFLSQFHIKHSADSNSYSVNI